ncbi:4'-phosphopantetheinyl transferase superfamily protein [Mangrovibacterium sp.]|uniref:4'-phosphopantetheinyl transferase family protein n=1 Tax=Mangrovibacterium sp. TaxID=1961364 RepID=UPI003568F4E2
MPLLKQNVIDEGLLLLWEMTESDDEISLFANDYHSHPDFLKIHHPQRQKEWLCIRRLLHYAKCDLPITYNQNGKPQIEHEYYKSISISHSAKLAGLYLHPSKLAGLDIESEDRNFKRVEKKYLCESEIELANKLTNGPGLFWCMKEAAYKAAGIPGLIFNEQIEINMSSDGSFTVHVYGNEELIFQVYQLKLAEQLIVCLTPFAQKTN